MAWIKNCIDHLPFSKHLRQLNIRIKTYAVSQKFAYPTLRDYEDLYRIIEPLHERGALKRVGIEFISEPHDVEASCSSELEVARVQEAFAPLLEGGQFVVEIRV